MWRIMTLSFTSPLLLLVFVWVYNTCLENTRYLIHILSIFCCRLRNWGHCFSQLLRFHNHHPHMMLITGPQPLLFCRLQNSRHSHLLMQIIQLHMLLLRLLIWCHLKPMYLHVLLLNLLWVLIMDQQLCMVIKLDMQHVTYQYVEAPLPFSLYDQYSMSQHVPAPIYSTVPYYQHDPYQPGNANSHYQQSTYERYISDILNGSSSSSMLIC